MAQKDAPIARAARNRNDPPVLVVGVGASAGGIEPLQKLLSDLPRGRGLSILVMFHLDPEVKSLLAEVLAKSAPLPVAAAQDGMPIEADHIYTIPGHSLVQVENGVLTVTLPTPTEPQPVKIAINSGSGSRA